MAKRKTYTQEEIQQFKKDICEYDIFKNMDFRQKAELLLHYEKQFSSVELAELWGIKTSQIYSTKYQLKRQGFIEGEINTPKSPPKKKPSNKKVAAISSVPASQLETVQDEEKPKQEIYQLPVEYLEQVQIVDPSGNDLRISLDEFMKMLEIQERMAKMIEQQSQRKNSEGFQFNFSGDFSAQDLAKKLQKVLTLIDGENGKFGVKFELYELSEEEEEPKEDIEEKNELLEEVNSLQEKVKEMQKQLEEQKEKPEEHWGKAYASLKTDKKGLHHPRSEYEKSGEFTGSIKKDGKTLYQTFYICPSCSHKGKHFLENGTIYANCGKCGKRMRVREAVKGELLKQDAFGNYFIAGKFLREDEINKDKPLVELWNIQ